MIRSFVSPKGLQPLGGQCVGRDFAAQFKFLGDWKRFPRVAVVARDGWLKDLARTVSAVLPQIEVRTFLPRQSEDALAFASQVRNDRIGA